MHLHKLIVSTVVALSFTAVAGAACLPSGTSATIQNKLNTGADAILCPSATFTLTATVNFVTANQQIYTEGLPTGATRAKLRIASSAIQTAVSGMNKSGVKLRHVIVDGARPTYGYVRPNALALVSMGGEASGQVVEYCEIYEPRGWTALEIYHGAFSWNGSQWTGGCSGATVQHNYIHHAGDVTIQKWADGISHSCRASTVRNNTVLDATDGGIVVFGAPGSIVEYNTVENVDREALGGILMVDTQFRRTVTIGGIPTTIGDYTGTIVRNNTVIANVLVCPFCFPRMIKVGIGMGPRIWWCAPPGGVNTVYGGQVLNNTLHGNAFGVGMAIDGVANWTATGNFTDGSFYNLLVTSTCGGQNAEKAFVKHSTHSQGTFQPEFVEGQEHHAHPY